MHGKAIWKSGIGEIAKASRGIDPGPHKVDIQHPIWTSSCKGQCGGVNLVMAYGNKTQSFMKNGGQQKYLHKALQGHWPWTPKGGLTALHMNPSCNSQRAGIGWVMAHDNKTQYIYVMFL